MKEKIAGYLGVVLVLIMGGWVVTYIPVVSDSLPSLMVAPTPTVTLDYDDLTVGDVKAGKFDASVVKNACKKIPFMMRPIASKPAYAKIVFTKEGETLGDAAYRCRDYVIVDMNPAP